MCAGGLMSLAGISFNCLPTAWAGFFLMGTSYYVVDDIISNQDEFADLREESQRRERLWNKKRQNKTEPPRKIVLDYIADSRDKGYVTDNELLDYAKSRGYTGSLTDLLKIVENINLSNQGNEFEQAVVNPLKRVQGIYD